MLDKETTVPIHTLDRCPWNSKSEIQGPYKVGLKGSLDYFKICDRLKIWPNPKQKGRYIIINGNQRIGLIIQIRTTELICEHFGLDPKDEYSNDPVVSRAYRTKLKEVQADPANAKTLQNIHAKVMQSQVDVQIMSRLDEADARLFVGTYDRNQSKVDEAKLVNQIYDQVVTTNNASRAQIERMLRPEKAFLQPLPRPETPHTPTLAPSISNPINSPESPTSSQPSEPAEDFGKWGPPPPVQAAPPPKPALIPFVLSLTPEGHKEIENHILKNSSRLFREKTLTSALKRLDEILEGSDLDDKSIVCEIALLLINRRAEILLQKKF